MKIYIETERLYLRDWIEADVPTFAKMNADEQVMEYFLKPLSREESIDMLKIIKTEIASSGFGFFALERKEDGALLGMVGLHQVGFDVDFVPAVEIGWRLLPAYWGKGYTPEAALGSFQFAKEQLSMEEIVAFTALPNKKSQRVMQKIGMEFEKEFDHPLVSAGHPLQRHVLYKKRLKQ